MFELDPRLKADTHFILQWPLSQVLLMDDRRYPWLILVPTRLNVSEPFDLTYEEQALLSRETMALGELMKEHFAADKVNIAALGNVVPQLHVHVIARFEDDDTFPSPVWGLGHAERYELSARESLIDTLHARLRDIEP
jgi:diadenosine tetraphosphate (Ap4A) HIT family hydrolase